MAVNAYLYFDKVEGPSVGRDKCIDILSLDWGIKAHETNIYSQQSSGHVDFRHVTIRKVIDKTSPMLAKYCTEHHNFDEAYIAYEKPIGDMQEEFFRIELAEAVITAVDISADKNDPVPVETVTIAYRKIRESYSPEKDNGQLDAAVQWEYDIGAAQ